MKKLLALVFGIGLCSPFAHAQGEFKISGGAELTLIPLQAVTQDGEEDNTYLGSGAGRGVITSVTFTGTSEMKNFGMETDLVIAYGEKDPGTVMLGLGDRALVWWQPLRQLRFDAGKIHATHLTGLIGELKYGPHTLSMGNHFEIFTPFLSRTTGFLSSFTPIENLYVGVFIPDFGLSFSEDANREVWFFNETLTAGAGTLNNPDDPASNAARAYRIFQRTWLSAGYFIPQTAFIRLQFIGANPFGTVNWHLPQENPAAAPIEQDPHRLQVFVNAPRIEAAAAYIGIKNLLVDFGFKTWLPIQDWVTENWNDADKQYIQRTDTGSFWGGLQFALGLGYKGLLDGDLSLWFRADSRILRSWYGTYRGQDARIVNPMRLNAHIMSSYNLGFVAISVDFGMEYFGRNRVEIGGENPNADGVQKDNWEYSDRLRFGGGLWIDKNLGLGLIQAGLTYRHGTDRSHGAEKRVFSVPVIVTFNF